MHAAALDRAGRIRRGRWTDGRAGGINTTFLHVYRKFWGWPAKCIGLWVIVPTPEAVPEVVYSARGCIEIQSSFPLNIKHTRYGQHHTWAAANAATALCCAAILLAAASKKDTHLKVMAHTANIYVMTKVQI